MIKIVFMVPEPDMVEPLENIYAEYAQATRNEEGGNFDYGFTVCVARNQRSISRQLLDADIVIGRGKMISDLKQLYPRLSHVEVPIGSEMTSVLMRIKREHPGMPVAVFGSPNMGYAAAGLGKALEMELTFFRQENNDDSALRRDMEKMLAAGFRAIVCGPITYRYAEGVDCLPYRLEMNKESVWRALSEAKHRAVMQHQQRIRSVQFQAVLNSAHEGIIVTDSNGLITVFSAHAATILRIASSKAIGARVFDVLPMDLLPEEFRSLERAESIISYRGEYLSINKAAVFLGGELTGHVITMQGSSFIRKAESKFRQILYAREHVAGHSLDEVIGDSPAIRSALDSARAFAKSSSNVLIIGETGTGKALFAEGIHNAGSRRDAPFAAIDCGLRPIEALERRLFGHAGGEGGDTPGLFEEAHTGTLLLDNIAALPPELQGRMVQVLREGAVARPGAARVVPVDVRVMAASNRHFEGDVKSGAFDGDLFYRLNALALNLPSLKQRGSDLLHLAAFFLDEFCRRYRKRTVVLSDKACEALMSRQWPGNVRELRGVCESLAILNADGIVEERDIERAVGA